MTNNKLASCLMEISKCKALGYTSSNAFKIVAAYHNLTSAERFHVIINMPKG